MQVRPQRRLLGLAQVRRLAGERVEQHAAQRVDVGARVDALAADLLGRDVAERPDPLARAAQPGARAQALGQPEVREVRVVAGAEQDVGGLDVAVDQAARVRGVERAADLVDDARRAPGLDGSLGADRRGAGPTRRRSASRCTASRRSRPRSRSGARAGGRSRRRCATRRRSARGTPRPAPGAARSPSARRGGPGRPGSRGRRRPCPRGRPQPRCGGRRRRRLVRSPSPGPGYPRDWLASRLPCARPAPSARRPGASSWWGSRCRSHAAACGSRLRS